MASTPHPPSDSSHRGDCERVDTVLPKRQRRMTDDDDLDITPMIDVTFLLLIYFMVVSQMDPGKQVDLPRADYGQSVASQNAIVVTLSQRPDGELLVYRGDGKDDLIVAADVEDQEQAVATYVQQVRAAMPTADRVFLKAEGRVRHREVNRISRVIGEAIDLPQYFPVKEVR